MPTVPRAGIPACARLPTRPGGSGRTYTCLGWQSAMSTGYTKEETFSSCQVRPKTSDVSNHVGWSSAEARVWPCLQAMRGPLLVTAAHGATLGHHGPWSVGKAARRPAPQQFGANWKKSSSRLYDICEWRPLELCNVQPAATLSVTLGNSLPFLGNQNIGFYKTG